MSWIDDIGQDGFFKGMADAIKSGSGTGGGPASPRITGKDDKAFKDFIKSIKDTNAPLQTYNSLLNLQKVQVVDVTETIKKFDEAIEDATDVTEIAALQEQKQQAIKAQSNQNLKASATNLTIGFAKATGTLLRGSLDYVKGLLSGQDGITAATNLAASQARATGEAVSAVGSSLGALSSLASILPVGRALKIAFMALTAVLGPLLEMLGSKAAELAEEGIKILGDELVKTRDNFQKLTGAGVTFANGMGEMRAQAGAAGMKVADFTNAITKSTVELASMGMGLTAAAKRIGGISGELRKGNLGVQLQRLGYSFEEQAALAAQTAANLNASGRLRGMSDKQVAAITAQYGKDLKVLQGITGEDAKKKMEEARTRSMEADLLAEAMAKGGPVAMEKLRNQLATMPEGMKKGYLEFVSSGGTAIADAATNVAMTQNPKIMEQYKQMYDTLGNGSKDATAALKETGLLTAATAQYARDNAKNFKDIALGARFTGDSLLQGATDITNGLILANQTFTKDAVNASAASAEKLSKTADPITNSINRLDAATNKQAVQMEQIVSTVLPRFASHLEAAIEPIGKFVDKINAALEKLKIDETSKAGSALDAKNREAMHMGDKVAQYTAKGLESIMGIIPVIGEDMKASAEKTRRDAETKYRIDKDKTIQQNKANRDKMTGSEKKVSKTAGFVEDLASFVPFFGTMLADAAEKERIKNETSYLETAKKADREKKGFLGNLFGFSKGGISRTPAIFGEKGPEAAVPLPDGRSIPVTLKLPDFGSMGSATDSTTDATSAALKNAFSDMYSLLSPAASSTSNSDAILQEIRDIMRTQITKHDEMISQLRDQVDLNQRMLSAYS
jgi:hypothetical protein